MALDVVAVAPTVAFLHEVAGLAEIGHDPERGSLGHAEPRQVTQSSVWLIREQQHRPSVRRRKPQSPKRTSKINTGITLPIRSAAVRLVLFQSRDPPWVVRWDREGSPPWTWWEWS